MKKEQVKSKIAEASKQLANNLEFYVVEKPGSPEDNPLALTYKSDPISFGMQMMGGLTADQVHGIYQDEDEALSQAHDLVSSVYEAAKGLEEKKGKVSEKLQKTISKLQTEVNKCLKMAKESPDQGEEYDLKAQQLMEKIKNLRSKHKLVEKSKKTLLDKDPIKKK
jgi:hypothetical protein